MTTPSQPPVLIGARGSKLSVVQATLVQRRIAAAVGAPGAADEAAPLIRITTTGDRVQDRRLLEIGGKGLFTKEIEEALLDRRIDCAVHSLKDMPAECPPGLVIGAIPVREDPRDVFISHKATSIAALQQGAFRSCGIIPSNNRLNVLFFIIGSARAGERKSCAVSRFGRRRCRAHYCLC